MTTTAYDTAATVDAIMAIARANREEHERPRRVRVVCATRRDPALATLILANDGHVSILTVADDIDAIHHAERLANYFFPHADHVGARFPVREAPLRVRFADGRPHVVVYDDATDGPTLTRDLTAWLPFIAPRGLLWVRRYGEEPDITETIDRLIEDGFFERAWGPLPTHRGIVLTPAGV